MSIDPVPYGQTVEDRAAGLHRWLIETLESLGAGWDLDGICDATRIAAVQTRAMAQALSWGLDCDIRSGNFGDETGLTSIRWIERDGALPARLMADWVVLWEADTLRLVEAIERLLFSVAEAKVLVVWCQSDLWCDQVMQSVNLALGRFTPALPASSWCIAAYDARHGVFLFRWLRGAAGDSGEHA